METTSRMKDFYDIYYISSMFDFDGETLKETIVNTTDRRKHTLLPDAFDRIEDFKSNELLLKLWSNFEPAEKANLNFSEAIDRLIVFINPIYDAILNDNEFNLKWNNTNFIWK
jgi:hypothetical protein